MRDIPTQGKQLNQQSITANRRKDETAEPCSEKVEVQASMVLAGPNPPPGRGGATKAPIHDATVTPKTALPKGVQKGKICPILTKCGIEQSTGALTVGVELSSAPCWCASFVHS